MVLPHIRVATLRLWDGAGGVVPSAHLGFGHQVGQTRYCFLMWCCKCLEVLNNAINYFSQTGRILVSKEILISEFS